MKSLRKIGVLAITGASLWLASCGNQGVEYSKSSIYGGTPSEEGAWPGAVALTSVINIFCTGTLVAPNIVYTAAHCIKGQILLALAFILKRSPYGNVRPQRGVIKMAVHPEYSQSPDNVVYDVGYVVLDQD